MCANGWLFGSHDRTRKVEKHRKKQQIESVVRFARVYRIQVYYIELKQEILSTNTQRQNRSTNKNTQQIDSLSVCRRSRVLSQYAWTIFRICLCTDSKWIDDFLTFCCVCCLRYGTVSVFDSLRFVPFRWNCCCCWRHSVVRSLAVWAWMRGRTTVSHVQSIHNTHMNATPLHTAIRYVFSLSLFLSLFLHTSKYINQVSVRFANNNNNSNSIDRVLNRSSDWRIYIHQLSTLTDQKVF